MEPLYLQGCRHDILGHYLKAIGLLRVLARCPDQDYRDPDAEGWWDMDQACFCLRSEKYPTMEKLVEFFEKGYQPTPVMAAWNKEIGGNGNIAKEFHASCEWEIAAAYASEVVSAADKKKPVNALKRTSAEAFAAYRDDSRHDLSEVLDAVAVPRFCRSSDNPVFLAKGIAGRAHLWRSYWEYLEVFAKLRKAKKKEGFISLLAATLAGRGTAQPAKGKGTPFFPDAIKGYNIGSGWVQENYPFNALDYVLAVEGAFALRGTAARTIGASSKRFVAFPFVFDAGEDLVDDGNEIKGTASALWLPLWSSHTTFAELASFISDAQARLPGKDARFSAEFVRALNAQGVDAGFSGWQEFRFKMKGSRVPWITTGRYVGTSSAQGNPPDTSRANATLLNRGLAPLDESRFLDQFDMAWKGSKADSRSPHPVRAAINAAMETAAHEPTPHHCLALLESIFSACRQMCVSESFREKLRGRRASFFEALPMEEWNELLNPLEKQAEFRIARSLASITGLQRQSNGDYSPAQPMLGSLLPLTRGRSGWFLPEKKGDRTQQDVWTGADLPYDLAAVLRRRYMDSLKDEQPALRAVYGAKLDDVLAFLRGELDDRLIARWTEAMSLIGWHFGKDPDDENAPESASEKAVEEAAIEDDRQPLAMTSEGIEPAYAALRTLLELECEWQGKERAQWKKRRSQQPFALLCQRSASSLPLAVSEAFRWISIWGVRNPWGAAARAETPRITGRYVVRLDHGNISSAVWDQQLADRLAAAVCIPLRWQDCWQLYRAVTLPPGI
ncbi:MAG: type I-U CRISPR-associated protein Csx17 [Acidobacteriia bacterium]|nr:type I-U CRISPR-associated protein Csx17 [Terriglobia bacterium]